MARRRKKVDPIAAALKNAVNNLAESDVPRLSAMMPLNKEASRQQEDYFAHLETDINNVPVTTMRCEPVSDGDMAGQFTSAGDALRFMRAGNATVTLRSKKTGTRFTYRLRESDDKKCYFVALLNGPHNDSDYKYLGRISRDVFWAGRKVPRPGDIAKDAPSVNAFAWSWRELLRGVLPAMLEVWHEGRCGRCGRTLTVPESIAHGFGPECYGKL